MKPNLVFVQPVPLAIDIRIEEICESFCDSHYVYLVRPGSAFRDDSPAGVRFLSNPLDRLPGFAKVETVVLIGHPQTADLLRNTYPHSKHTLWDPEDESRLPDLHIAILRPTVVHGDFGPAEELEYDRAI